MADPTLILNPVLTPITIPTPPSPPPLPTPEQLYPGSGPLSPQRLAARCLAGVFSGNPPYLVRQERWHFPMLDAEGKARLQADVKDCVYRRVNFLLGLSLEDWIAQARKPGDTKVAKVPDLSRSFLHQVARLTLAAATRALPGPMLSSYERAWQTYLTALEALQPADRMAAALAAGVVVVDPTQPLPTQVVRPFEPQPPRRRSSHPELTANPHSRPASGRSPQPPGPPIRRSKTP